MNYKSRIISFDGDKHDRALLALALRSALPDADVLEASTAVEVAHHVSAGPVDAMIADPVARFGEVISITADIRKRWAACQCWLFSGEGSLPALRDCVGRGIDGRVAKTSSGFLELPRMLVERIRWLSDLQARLSLEAAPVFSSIFPGATCLVGDDGGLLMVSEDFERLVEQPRFSLLGQSLTNFWLDKAKREEWETRMARPPRHWDFVGRFKSSRPEKPMMAITLKMLGSEPSGRKLWAASMTDVSSIAGAAAAENSDVAADREHMLFSLSHDLQAPLNSLASHAKALSEAVETESPQVLRTTAEEIGELTQRMQSMLNGIIDYSMPDSDGGQREIVSLEWVLEQALSNLRSQIDDCAATIEHEALPSLALNRAQMTQVFQNLISNGIKFCGDRIPRIRIRAEQSGEFCRIRFEDNGIGIDPAEHERIFNLFHRAHRDGDYPGVGAGLAICRRIVRAHGGDIRVESSPGRGSCFVLEFRAAAVRMINSRGSAEAVGS